MFRTASAPGAQTIARSTAPTATVVARTIRLSINGSSLVLRVEVVRCSAGSFLLPSDPDGGGAGRSEGHPLDIARPIAAARHGTGLGEHGAIQPEHLEAPGVGEAGANRLILPRVLDGHQQRAPEEVDARHLGAVGSDGDRADPAR